MNPGAVIGIIGGGQLGRMSAQAAARLGFLVHVFSPEQDGPAAQVAARNTVAAYDDLAALRTFAEAVDVITFEFENLPASSLELLESLKPVRPGAKILAISQDRILEKQFLNDAGIATAPWAKVESLGELEAAVAKLGLPAVLKTTRLGYDGKGQAMLRTPKDLAPAFERLSPKPLVLEGFVEFGAEISVMVARGVDGTVRCFDTVENRHKHHILDLTLAPAPLGPDILEEAQTIARVVAEKLKLVGLLGVEMFVTAKGKVVVNEIAPRPHNSGHWTMDACPCSQFEMHIRAVAGLPLPPAVRHSDAVMKNLIGPDDIELWPQILATPGLIPHHYGKAEARPGRKMGHFNRLFPKGALPGELGIEDALHLAPMPPLKD
ncbi:5-(carboxyamino)imidazole ribonucleotide synthase [Acidocella aminolytica]|jgi:5-(carboxyamino)imidazole ribonucleotide synthase|uniref:N5-carboxyaminoimidazole ribonucleotide synthase n=1 Tax=Acidocella aminolytica 101 = DSM 11237 TaxID=1120923 RepID=A0A0D6PFK3_9PROT|nr:5-(carboxyamino)imidazole ribonucleotide synthase [Acidocella aminolytica]GAN80462.1 phosphoribosylaminoimidazole carboxylase ATPase subunit [Acidocella aminolytica 101 = DSM 11237]GBQ35847.1 phosphoribosylaminoimidazole carboxylase ATPase subunit [Acidocella aminolytica 101 = DSM 11237]SHE95990.1 5-(carboxyamino)imidazole ribonucleotide synthase [Acidocella aminolytica 101 = DSM 11237]